jgi:hypothetical protein
MPSRSLTVDFIGDTASLQKELASVKRQLKGLQTATGTTSALARKNAKATVDANKLIGTSFKNAAKAAIGLSTAYIGIAKAKDAVRTTQELAHQTIQLHRNLGLTVQTSSELGAVLKARGIDANSAAMAFQTLSRQVVAGEQGSKKVVAAFEALGISQKDLKASGGDLNKLLPAIAQGFGGMKGGTERAAVAQTLLARGYKSLLPLFAQGEKGFQGQLDAAKRYGAVLSDDTLKKQEDLIKAQREMSLATMGLKVSFANVAAPALTEFSHLVAHVAADLHGPGSFDDKLAKIGHDVGPAIGKIEDEFHRELPKVASFAGHEAPKIAGAFVNGFINTDAWGKLAIGAFLVSKTVGWGTVFKGIGSAGAKRFAATFVAEAGAESAIAAPLGSALTPEFKTLGRRLGLAMRVGIVAGITVGLYDQLVGPFNATLEKLTGQINATDPTNGRAQQRADARTKRLYGGFKDQGNLPRLQKTAPKYLPHIPKKIRASAHTSSAAPLAHASRVFSKSQLMDLWVAAGGSKSVANIAAAIAMAESGGNQFAHNRSGASGLWQILGQVVPGNIYDPMVNARNAVTKWRDAGGFTPWTTFTGADTPGHAKTYLNFLGGGSLSGGAAAPVKQIQQATKHVVDAAKQRRAAIEKAAKQLAAEKKREAQAWAKVRSDIATMLKAQTVDTTINNPWLQAALQHTQNLVGAGQLTQAQGDALQAGYLQGAMPHLTGENPLLAQGQINGLTPSFRSQLDQGLSNVDLHVRAGDLTQKQGYQQEIDMINGNLLNPGLTDQDRLELRAELGDLTKALNDNTDELQTQNAQLQQQNTLLTQQRDDARRAMATSDTTAKALMAWIHSEISTMSGMKIAHRGLGGSYGLNRIP